MIILEYRNMTEILSNLTRKIKEQEILLLDVRDGTNKFYKEKREFPRVKGGVTAQIVGSDNRETAKVIDISYVGALLQTNHKFEQGEVVELNIHLTLFAEPIYVKSQVLRINLIDKEKNIFSVAIKFLDISGNDRQKLEETIEIINRRDITQ
jgi:Tfp pilus assembly protein PilZ